MTGELTRKEFDILVAIKEAQESLSQRNIETVTGYSLGTVNRKMRDLEEKGYIAGGVITSEGEAALAYAPPWIGTRRCRCQTMTFAHTYFA